MGTIFIETEKPVAYDSPDHIQPWGTALNNSVNPRFNRKLFAYLPATGLRVLDIGCSGGGFVKSILDAGGFAVGVEGSDYSQRHRRAEWATIPEHLFTADVTVPFDFFRGGPDGREPLRFDLITAWELLEHIEEEKIADVVANVRRLLAPRGIFLASIAPFEDVVEGVRLHQTVHDLPWWAGRMDQLGLRRQELIERYFYADWIRGGPGTASFAVAFTRKEDPLPAPSRLKLLNLLSWPSKLRKRVEWRLSR